MPGVQTTMSDLHLFPEFAEKDAIVARLIEENLFFAPFIKEAKAELITNTDGSTSWKVRKIPTAIVVSMDKQFNGSSTFGEMPLRKRLTGEFARGDQNWEDTGEIIGYDWRRMYIGVNTKTIQAKKGLMSDMRDASILRGNMKRLESLYEESIDDLKVFFSSRKNGDFISAIYDGADEGVCTGLDDSPNGVGLKRVFHPNMYVNTVSPTSGGDVTTVGTEGYSKTPAEITTALHSNFSNIQTMSDKFVSVMAIKCSKLKIQKAVEYNGRRYWLAVINRQVLAQMTWNEKIKNIITNATNGQGEKGIYFGELNFVYGEFMWVVDNLVPRAWDNNTQTFKGSDSYHEIATYATGKSQSPVVVMGAGALGILNPIKFTTGARLYNFNYLSEYLGLEVYGLGRGEYVADEYLAQMYNIGNKAVGTLATAIPITNQYSALFFVNDSLTVS